MAVVFDCDDPNSVLDHIPCLNCLSIHQLWVVLAGLLANANGNAGDLDALEQSSAVYKGLSEKKFLIGLIAALPDSFWSGLDIDDVGQEFTCLTCLSTIQVKQILLREWCEYFNTNRD